MCATYIPSNAVTVPKVKMDLSWPSCFQDHWAVLTPSAAAVLLQSSIFFIILKISVESINYRGKAYTANDFFFHFLFKNFRAIL